MLSATLILVGLVGCSTATPNVDTKETVEQVWQADETSAGKISDGIIAEDSTGNNKEPDANSKIPPTKEGLSESEKPTVNSSTLTPTPQVSEPVETTQPRQTEKPKPTEPPMPAEQPEKDDSPEEDTSTVTEEPEPTPLPEPEKPDPTPTPTVEEPAFDIGYWISYAQNYAQSVGLRLESSAVECWDNPITAGPHSTNLERDIQGMLGRYAGDEDITDVWIWSESIGDGEYNIYIGYA